MKTPICCIDYQGEDLKTVLSRVPIGGKNVLLCGTPPDGGHSALVGWVYNPAVLDEWSDAGTYLGQEEDQASVVSLRQPGREVRLRWSSSWFDGDVSATAAGKALRWADELLGRQFKTERLNFSSPVALGRHLMAASWKLDGLRVPPAPPKIRELLTTMGPQGRHECLTLPDLETIPALYGYDMRLAYLWCCKGLPFGSVREDPTDQRAQKVEALIWEAPDGWSHIGLLPMREGHWRYPEVGAGWIDARERDLARRNGWEIEERTGLVWENEGALDRWVDGLQNCLRESREDRIVYRLFRRVALNTIGSLHRSSVRRSRALPTGGREKPPAGNPSLRLSADGSVYFWQEETPLPARSLLYCHPEWTTTIWARCRARLAQAALQFPREQVIAIRQDALFVTTQHLYWKDDGAIGRFRCKERWLGPMSAPHSLDELQALRRMGE